MKTKVYLTGQVSKKELEEIGKGVRRGQLVIFPTETVYGIGALSSHKQAIDRIYRLKGRSQKKPLSFHIGAISQLRYIRFKKSRIFEKLKKRFWPGPLTLIVQGSRGKTVGLRFPSHRMAQQLIVACGKPLLATSVNKSGEPSCTEGKHAKRLFFGKVDFILNCGKTPLKKDSTIVDLSRRPYRILREGPKAREIKRLLRHA